VTEKKGREENEERGREKGGEGEKEDARRNSINILIGPTGLGQSEKKEQGRRRRREREEGIPLKGFCGMNFSQTERRSNGERKGKRGKRRGRGGKEEYLRIIPIYSCGGEKRGEGRKKRKEGKKEKRGAGGGLLSLGIRSPHDCRSSSDELGK